MRGAVEFGGHQAQQRLFAIGNVQSANSQYWYDLFAMSTYEKPTENINCTMAKHIAGNPRTLEYAEPISFNWSD